MGARLVYLSTTRFHSLTAIFDTRNPLVPFLQMPLRTLLPISILVDSLRRTELRWEGFSRTQRSVLLLHGTRRSRPVSNQIARTSACLVHVAGVDES